MPAGLDEVKIQCFVFDGGELQIRSYGVCSEAGAQ